MAVTRDRKKEPTTSSNQPPPNLSSRAIPFHRTFKNHAQRRSEKGGFHNNNWNEPERSKFGINSKQKNKQGYVRDDCTSADKPECWPIPVCGSRSHQRVYEKASKNEYHYPSKRNHYARPYAKQGD
jgi:hypothetical protein